MQIPMLSMFNWSDIVRCCHLSLSACRCMYDISLCTLKESSGFCPNHAVYISAL